MRILKNLFNFYVNSSIHVALAVYALAWITLLDFRLKYDESILYFLFYATITGYNFVKYFGVARFRHRNLAGWLRFIQILSLACFILMCYYGVQLEIKTLMVIGAFAILTFFYAIPIFGTGEKTLRSITGLKVFVIALVWAGATVLLPLINSSRVLDYDVVLELAQRFIFVLVLMIPFEIRDLKFDSLSLRTIPQTIGVRRTKVFGFVLLSVFLVVEFFKTTPRFEAKIAVGIISMLTALCVGFSKVDQSKYYSAFWVESLPILWLILLFLLM